MGKQFVDTSSPQVFEDNFSFPWSFLNGSIEPKKLEAVLDVNPSYFLARCLTEVF
jgi:hypothetical protein